jgi:hypothetical protein
MAGSAVGNAIGLADGLALVIIGVIPPPAARAAGIIGIPVIGSQEIIGRGGVLKAQECRSSAVVPGQVQLRRARQHRRIKRQGRCRGGRLIDMCLMHGGNAAWLGRTPCQSQGQECNSNAPHVRADSNPVPRPASAANGWILAPWGMEAQQFRSPQTPTRCLGSTSVVAFLRHVACRIFGRRDIVAKP